MAAVATVAPEMVTSVITAEEIEAARAEAAAKAEAVARMWQTSMRVGYTYADYLSWEDGRRWELIEGSPRLMAAPSWVHQDILVALTVQLAAFLEGKKCRVFPAPLDVLLFAKREDKDEKITTVVQPDLIVVCDEEKLADRRRGCKGAPDLALEILSPHTGRYDRVVKYGLYEDAGVREYWLVDPEAKTVTVSRLENGRYGEKRTYTEKDRVPVGILDGCIIDLERVFRA